MKRFAIHFTHYDISETAYFTANSKEEAVSEFQEEFPVGCAIDGVVETL